MKRFVLISLLGSLALLFSCHRNHDPFTSTGEGDNTFGFYCEGGWYSQRQYINIVTTIPLARAYKHGDDIVVMADVSSNYAVLNPIDFVSFRIPSEQMKEGRTIQLSGDQVMVYYGHGWRNSEDEYENAFLYPVAATLSVKKFAKYDGINHSEEARRNDVIWADFQVSGTMFEQNTYSTVSLTDGVFDIVLYNGSWEDLDAVEEPALKYVKLYEQYLEFIKSRE